MTPSAFNRPVAACLPDRLQAVKISLALGLISALFSQPLAQAADFSNVQHVYAPPTVFERRIDFNESRETEAVDQYHQDHPGSERKLTPAGPAAVNHKTTPSTAAKHPYGNLPSPPVVSDSGSAGAVPPPPPYPASLQAAAKDLQGRIKKAASTPAVQAAVKEIRQQAEEYARSGQMAKARHAVAEALQLTPHDKTLIRELGKISAQRAQQFMQTANLEDATKFARQALTFDASNGEAAKVLDSVLQKQGINPYDPRQRLHNGDLLASQGHTDDAWVEYQAANHLKPSAEAHVGMGNLALRVGEKDRAKSEYLEAEEINPSSPLGHRQLGVLKLQKGDIVGANTELSRALVLDPHDQGAAKELVELWQNQVSKVPGANSHLGLARAYQLSGDLQSAQAEYRDVVAIDPQNPHLAAARQSFKLALAKQEADRDIQAAETLESQGAIAEACDKLTEAVRLSPGDADLRVHQGYLLEQLSRYSAAHDAYMDALKINPHNLLAAARLRSLPAGAGAPVFLPQPQGASGTTLSGQQSVQDHEQHLNNLSNFAYALRNHMMLEKNNIQDVEDQAHDVVANIGRTAPRESLVSTDPLGSAGSGSSLPPLSSLLGSSSGASGAGSAASSSSTNGLSDSVASTLARARAAIAQAGGTPSAGGSAPSPLSASAGHWSPPFGSQSVSSPSSSTSMPPLAPPMFSGAGQASSTPYGNSGFGSPPMGTSSFGSPPMGTSSFGSPPMGTSSFGSPPMGTSSFGSPPMGTSSYGSPPMGTSAFNSMPTGSSAGGDLIADSAALALPTPLLPPIVPTTSSSEPPLAPPINLRPMMPVGSSSGLSPVNVDPSAFGGAPLAVSPIKFELVGASPKVKGVQLSVMLRNDGDRPLFISRTANGIIHYANRPDASVKVTFDSSAVPAHSTTHGSIHVPFADADPSADLVLPNFINSGNGASDIHLVANLAALGGQQ